MSDEKKFKRSEVGHDAVDLHRSGAQMRVHSEREDLESAIEALKEDEEIDELENLANEIEAERLAEKEPAPVEEPEDEPVEKPIDEKPVSLANEDILADDPENQHIMTIDEVIEPAKDKKRCGKGWKIATVFFFLLFAAACGAAAYFCFNNMEINVFDRTLKSSRKETEADKKNRLTPAEPKTGEDLSGYIVVPEWNVKINTNDAIYVSHDYNAKDSSLGIWAVTPGQYSDIPSFASANGNDACSKTPMVKLYYGTSAIDGTVYDKKNIVYTMPDDSGYLFVEYRPSVCSTEESLIRIEEQSKSLLMDSIITADNIKSLK